MMSLADLKEVPGWANFEAREKQVQARILDHRNGTGDFSQGVRTLWRKK